MLYKSLLIFFSLLVSATTGFSQMIGNDYSAMSVTNEIPSKILSTRSVVFIDAEGNWKKLAEEAQKKFAEIGVDAVAWYRYQDITAGPDATRAFTEKIIKRKIENGIVLSVKEGYMNLLAFQLVPDKPLFDSNQKAYKIEAQKINDLMVTFSRAISNQNLERSNFLIIDKPEYFSDASIIRGQRFESYQPDLKLDRLAVPKFQEAPNGTVSSQTNSITSVEESGERLNQQLETIMQLYPFKYELVDYKIGEERIRQAGDPYVLLYLYSTEENIKNLLGYKPTNNQLSTKKVYKFYIKHIYTGDIYVGSVWDPAERWQDALSNFIMNMKTAMKIQ